MPSKNLRPIEPPDLLLALKSTLRKVLETSFIYETHHSGGKTKPTHEDADKGITASLMDIALKAFTLEHQADQLGKELEHNARDLCNDLNKWIFRYLSETQIIQIKNSVRQRRLREKHGDRIRSRLTCEENRHP